jgi:hypothetical protein
VKTDTRTALVRLACLGLAGYLAWPLLELTLPQKPLALLRPHVERVRLAAPKRKVVEERREQVIIRSQTAPTKKLAPRTIAPVAAPLPPAPEPAPTPPPVPEAQPEVVIDLALTQPAPPPRNLPPAPPDDLPTPTHFNDQPGGSVVVLAVKLNSDNVVVMTDILVTSSTPFNDLAFSMGTQGVKWQNVNPPIPPGQYRWVELRLDYASEPEKNDILP